MKTTDLISRKAVLAKCGGISQMTLWRWERDPKVAFPPAIFIRARAYYNAAAVDVWISSQGSELPDVSRLQTGAAA